VLGWRPTVQFRDLVRMMVEHDMQQVSLEIRDDSTNTPPQGPSDSEGLLR